jgi:hypothetical protein
MCSSEFRVGELVISVLSMLLSWTHGVWSASVLYTKQSAACGLGSMLLGAACPVQVTCSLRLPYRPRVFEHEDYLSMLHTVPVEWPSLVGYFSSFPQSPPH